ncbi:MoaD/ThiS family protein [Nanoarchaeota archaeon]
MKVFVERKGKKLNVDFEGTGVELLKRLKVNSEEVILVRNGEVVTTDAELENSDKVDVLSVVSGG